MKNMKLLACLVALATVAGAASALADHPVFSLGLGAEWWNAKDADKFDEDGLLGGGIIARLRPSDYLAFDIRLSGVGEWKDSKWRDNGVKYYRDSSFYCVPAELGLVLMLPLNDALTIYAGPGVGYYYYEIETEIREKENHRYHRTYRESVELEDDVGWFAVAGLNISLAPNISIFGEARYTDTETSLKHNDDQKWEFDASGVGVMAGIMFDF